jgi:hypothetical protein
MREPRQFSAAAKGLEAAVTEEGSRQIADSGIYQVR